MIRRSVLPVLAAALAFGGSVVVAPAGQAAGACTLSAPAKVSVWKPTMQLKLTVGGECMAADGGFADWQLMHPRFGPWDFAEFNAPATSQDWDLYDFWFTTEGEPYLGLSTWDGVGAENAAGAAQSQNAPKTDFRLCPAAWITGKRENGIATLVGTALNYSPDTQAFERRPNAGGVFQFREVGSSTWQNLKAVTTNRSGQAILQYRFSRTREYRFATYNTPTVWTTASATRSF